MANKLIKTGIIVCACGLLTGCSAFPNKPSTSKVEQIAQDCINSDISYSKSPIVKNKNVAGTEYVYTMTDKRGIEFNLTAFDPYIALVEPIPVMYNGYTQYSTDYKSSIMNFYSSDIEAMLSKMNINEYKLSGNTMTININSSESLEDVANLIISIDRLLDYDYMYNGNSSVKLDGKSSWDGFCIYDLNLIIRDSGNEKGKSLVNEFFIFSDKHNNELTYDSVYRVLNIACEMKQTGTQYKLVQVNGELYYDSGVVTQDELSGSADGTTKKRINNIPKKDDQTNFGAGVDYQFGPDNELYVFLSDGRHTFLKY